MDTLIDTASLFLQTSQDKSIVVWEIKSQSIVTRLIGHTGVVVSHVTHTNQYKHLSLLNLWLH